MEVMFYIDSLKKGWWIILCLILGCLGLVMAYDLITPPEYQATARFIVYPNVDATTSGNELINSLDQLSDRSVLSTYSEIIDSTYIKQIVSNELGISLEEYDDLFVQSTVVLPNANIFETTLISYDPQLVKEVLNFTGELSVGYINDLYNIYIVSFLDVPQLPTEPISPQPLRDGILAVIFGAMIGVLLVIGKEYILMPVDEIRKRRDIDPTSKAYRKSYLEKIISNAMNEYSLTSTPFTVSMIRFEGLMNWLEILPEGKIDLLVNNASETITNLLKGSDIIGRWDKISFILYMPKTEENNAKFLMQKLVSVLQDPVHLSYINETINLEPQFVISQYSGNSSYGEFVNSIADKLE